MHCAVTEKELSSLKHPNLEVLSGSANAANTHIKTVSLENGTCLSYDKLCICTGAVPKVWRVSVILTLFEATRAKQV
jgi:NADH dehydrogenase FAD-containing subunit